MTTWYNEEMDPAGYGSGGYGEGPYGGVAIEWVNIDTETRNQRAAAQTLHIHPLHPTADGVISAKNRCMVAGVYPIADELTTWTNETINESSTWSNEL